MSKFATYGAAVLPGPGKKGIMKMLDNGYRECILGALGTTGNGGWIYDEKSGIDYIKRNPEFLQMMADKRMRSEWGHPVRTPGMSDMEWFNRVHTILESNWSSHIRRIHLSADLIRDPKGRPCIAIIGEVAGTGAHRDAFERIMDNPDEDLNYSVRSFTRNDTGSWRKHFTKIINYDTVYNPGQKVASKFNTPSMEAWNPCEMLDEVEFHLDSLREEALSVNPTDLSFESATSAVKFIDGLIAEETRTTVSMSKIFQWGNK